MHAVLNDFTNHGRAVGHWAVAVLALAHGPVVNAQGEKSKANTSSKITGKLISLTKKGRNTILKVVTADQDEQEYTINARVEFAITARGDKAFLSKGQFVWSETVKSNDHLFARQCTVLVSGRGKKPAPVFRKAPAAPRRSRNAYWVAGFVVSLQKDEEYPDYDALTVRIGKKHIKVLLEKRYTVTVRTTDIDLAEAGATVELEGKPINSKRFLLTKATIKMGGTLKVEDFLVKENKTHKRSNKKQ